MKLTDLTELPNKTVDPEIKGITHDSRQVRKGYLFAALPGNRDDGKRYIPDAVHNGAAAILAEPGIRLQEMGKDIAYVPAENPRRALAKIAARFYGRQPDMIAAVTGTNGKTSTVLFTQQIWEAMGVKAASLGTLGVRGHGLQKDGTLTTPDSIALQAELADLAAAGVTHLAMEASSHGLHQNRLDGVHVRAAGFTSFSRDHLDYHGSMEAYLIAKAHLFEDILAADGTAVLNADLDVYKELYDRVSRRGCNILSYGKEGADIRLTGARPDTSGQAVEVTVFDKPYQVHIPLVGGFQITNALCALGLVIAEAPDDKERIAAAVGHLADLKGAPGRLELVPGHPKGAVYVDYAHAPDALQNVLEALRPHTDKRLICVFGCGGDRDTGKRPLMGEIASRLSDKVIVTDDNPRSEDPAAIRAHIMEDADENAVEVADRAEAIQAAIKELEDGDILVIAGKGHERGQIVKDSVLPFDDVEEAQKAIKRMN